ncbi:hypothetical protein HPB52_021584 [Rhipicephalus sanguineus]|uniref:Uncharacterized protein n=1 Tax=Rhipicephalus sanguineus TaxID=34632 RepID=A0A9D4QAL3_RHISA|nr:hypothetical protein HPB52_021584 [Rhipicephalus sanguineus]
MTTASDNPTWRTTWGPFPGDVAHDELWELQKVLLHLELFGFTDPLELHRLVVALQRHLLSGRMSPDEKKHMAIQGGESTQQKTSRILKSMLSWNVAVQFSLFGAKGKKFSDLNICKLMCSSLTNDTSFRATLKDIEKAGMSWFRHATDRAAGERSTEADSA